MSKRKYQTEFGINAFCTNLTVFHQYELTNLRPNVRIENLENTNIYFICSRPRITLPPKNIHVEANHLVLDFIVDKGIDTKIYRKKFEGKPKQNFKIVSEYPYNQFKMLQDEKILLDGYTSLLASGFFSEVKNEVPFKVIYIGQSKTRKSKTIANRLLSHSKLQKIYSDYQIDNPNEEIWIFLARFEDTLLTTMAGDTNDFEATTEENEKHITEFLSRYHKETDQRVNLIEAGLIRYFQPRYNILLKKQTSSPKIHKSYKNYYDLELNTLMIEINTESVQSLLYSDVIPPKWIHIAEYPLYSELDRKSMFDLF